MTRSVLRDGTEVIINTSGTLIKLASGHEVLGMPQGTVEQADTAERLGYGNDTLAMVLDHDPLHALLADWLGLSSASLRKAAGLPADMAIARLEEAAVLAVQCYMRRAGGRLPTHD